MPQLKSTTGGRDVFVADDDPSWQKMVDSGGFKVADGSTASIVDPYGHQTVVGTDVVRADQAKGIDDKIESQAEVTKRARDKRLEDKTSTAGAFGRSLAGAATFGLTDHLADDETLEADQLHHGTASTLGTVAGIGGTLLLGNDFGLAKLLGEGEAASRIGVEAAELATTGDALAAEHAASGLSSSTLLGGGGKGSTADRALGRAGKALDESAATRSAIENVPQDLAGLDAKGLRQAAIEERASLKAQAVTEETSLEELRKPQREELANQIQDMHRELEAERPVFRAVQGDDVEAVAGVKGIQVQLAKSYGSILSAFDSPMTVARNPSSMIRPLEMRQAALESLQAKAPELRQVLGNDARAAALDHVDDALEQTRAQIAKIHSLDSRVTPVSGSRLTDLQSGMSPRLAAIEAAQEALMNAPKAGLLQRGAQAGAFAGVTALAHAIPGVGIMAPFAGKYASEAIGKAFEHLGAAKAAASARMTAARDAFLSVTSKVTPAGVAVAATRVLSQVRFGPSAEPTGKQDLASLYKARSAELRNQTMYDPNGQVVIRPDARQAIAQKLAPIAQVNPILADKLETLAVRKAEFISSMMPRQPDAGGLQIGPDNWKPSDLAMRSWARTVRASEDPGSVEEDLARGVVTPEAAMAYRTVYPERFLAMQHAIYTAAPTLAKTLPLRRKVALSIFTGVPLTPALQPNVLQVLQGNFTTEANTQGGTVAPSPQPSFGALGSLKSLDKPTPAQQGDQ
ncbi:MAG: hypothetical protein QFE16_12310 [Pseudomonadota bacterium]|nr:hypothetical protein [Pseudomonadota bacterium]